MAFSASPNAFFSVDRARRAAAGTIPKYLLGHQTYWTVIGVDGDEEEALINEDGMLEVGRRLLDRAVPLRRRRRLVTWHDVAITQTLEDGDLPIPTVTWRARRAPRSTSPRSRAGAPGRRRSIRRYRVDHSKAPRVRSTVRLLLAIRPFQVLPPWQSLNMLGGVSPIPRSRFDGRRPCG